MCIYIYIVVSGANIYIYLFNGPSKFVYIHILLWWKGILLLFWGMLCVYIYTYYIYIIIYIRIIIYILISPSRHVTVGWIHTGVDRFLWDAIGIFPVVRSFVFHLFLSTVSFFLWKLHIVLLVKYIATTLHSYFYRCYKLISSKGCFLTGRRAGIPNNLTDFMLPMDP